MKQSLIKRTLLERNIINLRKTIRDRLVRVARNHQGCPTPRGCGCNTDKLLNILEACEREMFALQIFHLSGAKEGNDHGGYDHYNKEKS